MSPRSSFVDHRDGAFRDGEPSCDDMSRRASASKREYVKCLRLGQLRHAVNGALWSDLAEHVERVLSVLAFCHVLKIGGGVVCAVAIVVVDFMFWRARPDKGSRYDCMHLKSSRDAINAQPDATLAARNAPLANVWAKRGCFANAAYLAEVADLIDFLVSDDWFPLFFHGVHGSAFLTVIGEPCY